MKLADTARDVQRELRTVRYPRRRHGAGHPANGDAWHNQFGVCSFCGCRAWDVMDHCHATGLKRGWLCYPCNSTEALAASPAWELWRLTAPMLPERAFYANQFGAVLPQYLTVDEVLVLPMGDLLALHAERRRAS